MSEDLSMLQPASWVGAGLSTCISLVLCKLRPWGRRYMKEGSSWMPSTKIQPSISKSIFWQAFKGVCRYRIFPVASKPQARKTAWILSQVSSLWCKLRPCSRWRLKEGLSWMQGMKSQHSYSKTLFLASILKPSLNQHRFAAPTVDTWGGWEDDPHALCDGGGAEAGSLRAHLAGEQAGRLQGDVVQVNPGLKIRYWDGILQRQF